MTLKVLTLNIWHDQGPWPERAHLIKQWIKRLEPDVIGFQEVLEGKGVDQIQDLMGDSGFDTRYGSAMTLPDRKHLQFGNAIASRWPIVDSCESQLPDRGDWETRAALTVTIDSPHGPIGLTCTHLHWQFNHGYVREKQVAMVAETAWQRRPQNGFPPIILGDFNAEPGSDEIRYMTGLHSMGEKSVAYLDAWEVAGDHGLVGEAGQGVTWSNRNRYAKVENEPRRRIDYVFVGLPGRKGLGAIESCRVVCNEEESGVWPTDHFGVFAELRTEQDAD